MQFTDKRFFQARWITFLMGVLFFISFVQNNGFLVAETTSIPSVELSSSQDHLVTLPKGLSQLTIRTKQISGQLFVRTKVNGQDSGYFLLDTGCAATVIDHATCNRLNLPELGRTQINGSVKITEAVKRKASFLSIGNLVMGTHEVIDQDLSELSNSLGFKIGGILGSPLFSQCPFTYDYRASTITFFDRVHFQPPQKKQMETLRFVSGIPQVKGKIFGKNKEWFMLDTGNSGNVTLTSPLCRTSPEISNSKMKFLTDRYGICGTERAVMASIEKMNILGRTFHDRFVLMSWSNSYFSHDGESVGSLGMGALHHFRLTFDYQEKQLWIEDYKKKAEDHWFAVLHQTLEQKAKVESINVADVNAVNKDGETALMVSAYLNSDVKIVEALIKNGARINERDPQGRTALMIAVESGCKEIVRSLLQNHADANSISKDGQTALILAAKKDDVEIAKLLIDQGASIDLRGKNGATALMWAACIGAKETMKFLILKCADLNLRNQQGQTALMFAAQTGVFELVRVLLSAGADMNIQDKDHLSALSYASSKCYQEIINLFQAKHLIKNI